MTKKVGTFFLIKTAMERITQMAKQQKVQKNKQICRVKKILFM